MSAGQYVRFGLPESDQAGFRSELDAIAKLPSADLAAYSLRKELVRSQEGYTLAAGAAMRIEKYGAIQSWRRVNADEAPHLGDVWRNEVQHA